MSTCTSWGCLNHFMEMFIVNKKNDLHNALLLFLTDFLIVVIIISFAFVINWSLAITYSFDTRKFQASFFTFAISIALFVILVNRIFFLKKNNFNSRTSRGVFIVQCFLIGCMACILAVAGVLMII